jgi:hypothetical protein
VVLYRVIPFEITQGISIPRFSWVQRKGGGIWSDAVSAFDCDFLNYIAPTKKELYFITHKINKNNL